MINEIILKPIQENENLTVECIDKDKGYFFVHDNIDGGNYFNQAVLTQMFGVKQQNISYNLNKFIETVEAQSELYKKTSKVLKSLEIEGTNQSVKFYGFDAVTYLAYKINSPEAFAMRDWIQDALNEKFNVLAGLQGEISTETKIKNEVERLTYEKKILREAYANLKSINHDKVADMIYHDFKGVEYEYNIFIDDLSKLREINKHLVKYGEKLEGSKQRNLLEF